MRLVFWQNCLSPHQLPYIVHLLDDMRVDEVVIVAGETVSDARKKMGWAIGMFDGLERCEVYIDPHNSIIESLLAQKPNESQHFFSGIHADAFVFKCLNLSMKYDLHRGMITERPNTYNFKWNIRNGKPYWLHRLRFFIQDRKYAKKMEHVFAIGMEAVYYFKSLGLGWKVHPFCYCTQTVPRKSNITKSLSTQFVFVGSLSPRKNPISLIKAFSTIKCGVIRFVGDGELKSQILEEIEKNNLLKNIYIEGTVSINHIPDYLYNSDVLVLPSLHDGWGAVINEALQAGCYVICSDSCGACMLLDKNPKLGSIFKTGDEKELAECLKYVNEHLDEIRQNRDFRSNWADEHISGRVVAKYFIDCIE